MFPTTDGVVEIINQTPGLAIVPVDTIVAGVDQLATAARVTSTERGVGYIVGDGNASNTSARGSSRLGGIKPKSANYDPARTWEDSLE